MADRVAAIDIPMDPQAAKSGAVERRTHEEQGLRQLKFSPAHVAVMTPHEMWDARDALSGGIPAISTDSDGDGLRDAVVRMARPAVETAVQAAPAIVTQTVVTKSVAERAAPVETPRLRPAVVRTEPSSAGRMIQLGAFSSPAGAQAAWARLKARADLSNLSPVFERVEVNGRSLTRLKVGPIPTEAASALCAAAQVADPWCRRAG
ncbi:SPOR domain-containing protein [Brevundimonas sp. SL130]|uniref:SPOR domain-containing protein n=1 Tax=Brevundimonas sp. SL130 TaxID=2995143 RepID=UPI00226C9EF2|nr:SPOR domain-containing protein [Brevundimonas sp. SL130]WAC61068.1 SPOR domain-containing protein [Brevundimonas sp. SL130]